MLSYEASRIENKIGQREQTFACSYTDMVTATIVNSEFTGWLDQLNVVRMSRVSTRDLL